MNEQAQPLFRNPKQFPEMADPLLKKNFPEKDLNQAVAVAAMCLQEEEGARPLMSDVVTALSFLSMVPPEVIPASQSPATMPPRDDGSEDEDDASYESESESESENEKQQESDTTGAKQLYSKSSTKKSGRKSSFSSEEESLSSSKKSCNLSQKSSKKSCGSDLKQKSSKKSGGKESSRKSSRKSSRRKTSTESEDRGGEGLHKRGSGSISQGDISFGLISSGESVQSDGSSSGSSSGRRSTEGVVRLGHAHTTKQSPKDHNRELLSTSSAKV